jgi:CheY-like chemotaxis protein
LRRFGLFKRKTENEKPRIKTADEKERLIDLFIHDLRGPLSIATASLKNLLEKSSRYGPLTDQQKRIVERGLRNTRKAQNLLQEMIELFLSEEGWFQTKPFFLRGVVKDSLLEAFELTNPDNIEGLFHVPNDEAFELFLKDRGIFIEVSGRYSKRPFYHDQKKVQQILRNLISNGLKYRRSRMRISVMGEGDLVISVEDDGPGIPAEDRQVIFERFGRSDGIKRAGVPGLGLGLRGVKALTEAMGGKIELLSGEGVGTCITILLPSLRDRKEGKSMKESILEGKRVLAVDDESDVLTLLKEEILEACPNCVFETATTYEEASSLLQSQDYDLVILDIMGVRGFDLLKLAVSRNLKVAMLTAHALTLEALKRSFEMKARSYLPKDKLGEVVPFLEDALQYQYLPGWKRLFEKMKGFFDSKFESDWEKRTGLPWQEWQKWE